MTPIASFESKVAQVVHPRITRQHLYISNSSKKLLQEAKPPIDFNLPYYLVFKRSSFKIERGKISRIDPHCYRGYVSILTFETPSQSSKVNKTVWNYARWGVKPNWDVFHTIWNAYWIIWHLLYDGTYAFICIIALKFDQFMPSAWGRTHLLVSSKYNNWTPRNLNSCLNIFPSISYPHRSTVTSFSGITGWK